jgi:hypothetical protein
MVHTLSIWVAWRSSAARLTAKVMASIATMLRVSRSGEGSCLYLSPSSVLRKSALYTASFTAQRTLAAPQAGLCKTNSLPAFSQGLRRR